MSPDEQLARDWVGALPYVQFVKVVRGVLHAYGSMPNTSQIGWFHVGFIAEVADLARVQEAMHDTPY